MRYGSLFSGGGLGDFGFELAGLELAWQVEINEYCRKILDLRWPEVKKHEDIKAINAEELKAVDLIAGGFPCQPFSVAGKQRGKDDNRYLWPEMLRIIKAKKPTWVVGENVPGIINLALDDVCADLEAEGYEVWPVVFPSHALGAWHKRDRLWIIAYSEHARGIKTKEARKDSGTQPEGEARKNLSIAEFKGMGSLRTQDFGRETLADARCTSKRSKSKPEEPSGDPARCGEEIWGKFWSVEPRICRVVDGCTNRVERLKLLGNGQTTCCTYVIGKMILALDTKQEEVVK